MKFSKKYSRQDNKKYQQIYFDANRPNTYKDQKFYCSTRKVRKCYKMSSFPDKYQTFLWGSSGLLKPELAG